MKGKCPICKKIIDEVEFMQYKGSCKNCAINIENSISDKNYENKAISISINIENSISDKNYENKANSGQMEFI